MVRLIAVAVSHGEASGRLLIVPRAVVGVNLYSVNLSLTSERRVSTPGARGFPFP